MFAEEAVQIDLIDRVSSFDDALINLASSLGSEEAPSSGRGVGGSMFVADETPTLNVSTEMEGDMPKGIFTKTPAKKIITPEAQAAILEGVEVSEAVGEEAVVETPVVEASEPVVEEPVVEAAETVAETVVADTQLVDKLVTLTTDLGVANAKVSELEGKLSAQEAVQDQLLDVVKEAINRMNVSLNASPQDFSACSAENLLAMHEQNQNRLRERYPVGQQVQSEDLSAELGEVSDAFSDAAVGLVSRKK